MTKIKLFDLIILVLSVYVLTALALSLFMDFPQEVEILLDYIDNAICVVFLFDFIRNFRAAPNKWEYMKWGWIDLVSSIPSFPLLRCGRTVRLIRLLRLLRAFKSLLNICRFIFKSRIKGTMLCLNLILVLLAIFSAITILFVENEPESNIKTAGDAIWWVFTSITTVGYGDLYPVTPEGRFIGILLMLSGVGLFGAYSGWIASFFMMDAANEKKKEKE